MLFRLRRNGNEPESPRALPKRSAAELELLEKDLENWLARHPELLFGGEEVLVVGQSISGHRMADILALDSRGNLILVEIKRDWSDRATVGQILEYAADASGWSYERLNALFRDYRGGDAQASLLHEFRKLSDREDADEESIRRGFRLCIVAPESDVGLKRTMEWLSGFGVPISFVPFALYADGTGEAEDLLIEIEHLTGGVTGGADESAAAEWRGDWIHNTNETYAPGAYRKMLDQGVIAIYGYPSGPDNLQGTSAGERVFAYVNGKGILACGHIVDGKVLSGTSVFGEEDEFHVQVKWESTVVEDQGVTNAQVRTRFGHGLPVRNVLCGLYREGMPDWIAGELRSRASSG